VNRRARFSTLASPKKRLVIRRPLQGHDLCPLRARARARGHASRPLIVSDVARNPRGHRKHVINTCSPRAHARANAAAAAQLSRADHTRLLPLRRAPAAVAPVCAPIRLSVRAYRVRTHASAAASRPHASDRCSANLPSLSLARRSSFRARAAVWS